MTELEKLVLKQGKEKNKETTFSVQVAKYFKKNNIYEYKNVKQQIGQTSLQVKYNREF